MRCSKGNLQRKRKLPASLNSVVQTDFRISFFDFRFQRFPGGHTAGVTPVPIPNTEVKPRRADDTARVTVWERRSLPGLKTKSPHPRLLGWGLFSFQTRRAILQVFRSRRSAPRSRCLLSGPLPGLKMKKAPMHLIGAFSFPPAAGCPVARGAVVWQAK